MDGGCDRAIHAEVNCLAQAGKLGHSTQLAELYTTHFPCHNCAMLLVSAGIKTIFYHREYHHPGQVTVPFYKVDPMPIVELLGCLDRVGYVEWLQQTGQLQGTLTGLLQK